MAKKKKSAASEADAPVDFETALAEVEQIVGELESGEAGLSESLAHYETGIKRLKQCHELLQKAERRITLLSGFDSEGNPVTEPFDSDDEPPTQAKRKSRGVRRKVEGGEKPRRKASKGSEVSGGLGSQNDDEAESVDDLPGLF